MKYFLVFLFPCLLFAKQWDKEASGIYRTRYKDTLKTIFIDKFNVPKELLVLEVNGEDLITKTKRLNPHVTLWDPIPINTPLYIELPKGSIFKKGEIEQYIKAKNATHASPDFLKKALRERRLLAKREKENAKRKIEVYQKVEEEDLQREEDILEYMEEREKFKVLSENAFPRSPKNTFGLFGFYALSQGTFNEEVPSQDIKATNDQNSPFTLGLGFHLKLGELYWLSGSYYSSHLTGTAENSLGETVDIPTEVGMNLYYNWPAEFPGLSFYTGLDKESFSTFNIDELQGGADLEVRNHDITFATVGLAHYFLFYEKVFLFKGSVSQSITSESTSSLTPYSGTKFITYLNYIHSKDYTFFTFWKNHNLSGSTDVSINRIGLGISKTFY